jgi:preprotein translocase subunit SecG
MFSIFVALISFVCFLLIIVVMVQNPKGGGLSSTFGSSQTIGGVQNTTDFLDKSTWTLATLLIVLIILSNLSFSGVGASSKVIDESAAKQTVLPTESNTISIEDAEEASTTIDTLIK